MTTKHRRWTVKRGKIPRKTDVSWIAYDAGGDIRGAFLTHALAVTYADRMARTVEVTLPRIGSQFTYKQRDTPSYDDITLTKVNPTNYQIRYAEDMGEDGRGIDMLADELKPLALALLAHHYRGTTP